MSLGTNKICNGIFIAVLTGVVLFQFWFIWRYDFIDYSDGANTGVVARNLVAGKGFSVDYLWHFYIDYPQISHPDDTWPLLHPLMVAPFYWLFKGSLFGVKVVNVLLFSLLLICIYRMGSYLFDPISGLLASCFILSSWVFEHSLVPRNDTGMCLFGTLALWSAYLAIEKQKFLKWYFMTGIWCGLAILQKQTALILPFVIFCYFLWLQRKDKSWWKYVGIYSLTVLILVAPYAIRNMILFGNPLFTTSTFAACLESYKNWEETYRVFYSDPPSFFKTVILGYGPIIILKKILNEIKTIWYIVSHGYMIQLDILILSLIGLIIFPKKYQILIRLFFSWAIMFFVFIVVYAHYELRYFILIIPFFCLFAGYASAKLLQIVKRKKGLSLILWGAIIVFGIIHPLSDEIQELAHRAITPTPYVKMCHWIKDNLEKDSVIMSRTVIELNFHTQRKTVMFPYEDLKRCTQIADKYGVDYIQVARLDKERGFSNSGMREYLKPLYQGISMKGLQKVYADTHNEIYIYKITPEFF